MRRSRRFAGIQFQRTRTEPGTSTAQQDEATTSSRDVDAGPSSVPHVGPSPSVERAPPSSSGDHDPPVDPPVDPAVDAADIQGNLFKFCWLHFISLYFLSYLTVIYFYALTVIYFYALIVIYFYADGSGTVVRRRGPTVRRDVWEMRGDERIVIECNKLGQPVKNGASLLTSFLGTIARRSQLCPLSYARWNDMLPMYKLDILRVIEVRSLY